MFSGWRSWALLLLVLLLLAVAVACRGPAADPAPFSAGTAVNSPTDPTPTVFVTATPWPTFTPAPIAPEFAASGSATRFSRPAPTGASAQDNRRLASALFVPPPPETCAGGAVGASGAVLVDTAFFPMRSFGFPAYDPGRRQVFYAAGDLRWLVWRLTFRLSPAMASDPDDAAAQPFYRWGRIVADGGVTTLAVKPGDVLEPVFGKARTQIVQEGLGADTPGFWQAGRYFAEAWTADCVIARHFFEIR